MKKWMCNMCGSSTGSFSPDRVQHQRRAATTAAQTEAAKEDAAKAETEKRRQPRQQRLQRKPRIQLQRKLRQRQANTM